MSLGRWWRQRRARLLQLWAVGLVAACAVTGASAMGYLKSLQAGALDLLIYLQSPRQPSEVSIELPELGHGIFTYYLVQGLKGAADLNKDGIVTVQELYEYVEQQVSAKSRSVGGNQHPVMKGEMEGALPLVKVR